MLDFHFSKEIKSERKIGWRSWDLRAQAGGSWDPGQPSLAWACPEQDTGQAPRYLHATPLIIPASSAAS